MAGHTYSRRAAALLLLSGAAPAWAQLADTVKANVAYTSQSDSNLLLLPPGANVAALTGRASAAEHLGITSLGVSVNKAYSLQSVELDVSLIDYRYQNFSYLSFTARNYNAAWRWSVTPRLHGSVTSGRSETLNSFADYQGFTQRNQRTNTNDGVNAEYEINGPLRLTAGVARSAQSNQQPLPGQPDYSANSANIGLRYLWPTGNTLSYTRTSIRGSSSNSALVLAGLLDDSYRETDDALLLHWVTGGNSTADFSVGHIDRSYPNYAQRDYAGMNAAVNLNWNLSGKSGLSASWTRDISNYQTANTNYSRTDRLSLGPLWQLSPKAVLKLQSGVTRLDYLGAPTSLALPQRSDTLRETNLSFDWQAHKSLSLSVALRKAARSVNLPGFDYDSRMTTVSAQFTY